MLICVLLYITIIIERYYGNPYDTYDARER